MSNFINRWLFGYVILHMWGKYVERFINLAIKAGLEIWDIRRLENHQFQLKINLKHFFKLKSILKETGTKMRLKQKIGFPFILQKLKNRKGVFFGIFLFVFALYMLSSTIWKVEINGIENISKETIQKAVDEIGIKVGTFKWKLADLEDLQRKLQQKLDDASWVGLKFDGVVAKITIVEKVRSEQKKELEPRNLVAKKKAVISKISVSKGMSKVSMHQLVNKGDILISGIMGPDNDPTHQIMVPAEGSVWGEVWYDATVSIPLFQEVNKLTGKSHTNRYLLIGNYPIKVWGFGKKDMDKYKTEEESNYLTILKQTFPFGWKKEESFEIYQEKYTLTVEEAMRNAQFLARKKLINDIGVGSRLKEEKVLQQWVENGKVYLKMHYSVIEEITDQAKIVRNESTN